MSRCAPGGRTCQALDCPLAHHANPNLALVVPTDKLESPWLTLCTTPSTGERHFELVSA
jgi:hypothetical protein